MSNLIRHSSARISAMLTLALLLLVQSLSLQASIEMVGGNQPGAIVHQHAECAPQSACEYTMNEESPDCCAAEMERHCSSGLCSVVVLGLNTEPLHVGVPSNLQPESAAVQLIGTAQSPPYPPPKAY